EALHFYSFLCWLIHSWGLFMIIHRLTLFIAIRNAVAKFCKIYYPMVSSPVGIIRIMCLLVKIRKNDGRKVDILL
ncbi:MAG: hypothetical protein LKM45_05820, partial [Wolbachia endosymbiont of Alcedoecus sp.]|nr:hypothetical protein [Wolbachia endosymbiont of Alcedoecus sp.]